MSDVTGIDRIKKIVSQSVQDISFELYKRNPIKSFVMVSFGGLFVFGGLGITYANYFENRWKNWQESDERWKKEQVADNQRWKKEQVADIQRWKKEQAADNERRTKEQVADNERRTKEQVADIQRQVADIQRWTRDQNEALQKKVDLQHAAENNMIKVNQQLARNDNVALKLWAERKFIDVGKKVADLFENAGPNLDIDKTMMTTSIKDMVEDVNESLQQEVKKVEVEKFGDSYNLEAALQLIASDMKENIDKEFQTRIEEATKAVIYDDKIPLEEKAKVVGNLAVDEASKREAKYFEHIARSSNKSKFPRL